MVTPQAVRLGVKVAFTLVGEPLSPIFDTSASGKSARVISGISAFKEAIFLFMVAYLGLLLSFVAVQRMGK